MWWLSFLKYSRIQLTDEGCFVSRCLMSSLGITATFDIFSLQVRHSAVGHHSYHCHFLCPQKVGSQLAFTSQTHFSPFVSSKGCSGLRCVSISSCSISGDDSLHRCSDIHSSAPTLGTTYFQYALLCWGAVISGSLWLSFSMKSV